MSLKRIVFNLQKSCEGKVENSYLPSSSFLWCEHHGHHWWANSAELLLTTWSLYFGRPCFLPLPLCLSQGPKRVPHYSSQLASFPTWDSCLGFCPDSLTSCPSAWFPWCFLLIGLGSGVLGRMITEAKCNRYSCHVSGVHARDLTQPCWCEHWARGCWRTTGLPVAVIARTRSALFWPGRPLISWRQQW